ncbi:MAG TPA: thiolase family protein [Vicinamibacterales bacterium]
MNAWIYGVGTTRFRRHSDRLPAELAWAAVEEALADAGVDPARIDAAYVGTVFGTLGVAQRALSGVGLSGIPIVTVENACASGSTALVEAAHSIHSGRYEYVLALGVEHLTSRFAGPIDSDPTDIDQATGLLFPGLYAMSASRYMHEHGATAEDLAEVAVKNTRHGALNPRAHRQVARTLEEVLASRMIAEPLTLYQCTGLSDAAAAAVLGPARRNARDIAIRGTALGSGRAWDHESPGTWGAGLVREVAERAYAEAGIEPADADVLEVHDAFTIGEIVTLESMGLVGAGEAPAAIRSGRFSVGGDVPVNPSGGLIARGHPLGATGLAQCAELVWQLRGEAGARQADAPRIAVLETMGGGVGGLDGNACVVSVLESGRPSPRPRGRR